jgi:hypothetical protein
VTITPVDNGRGGTNLYGSNWTNPITMTQGQTYQNGCTDDLGDLTGLRITADKPIAVFAGAELVVMPDLNVEAQNPLAQQLLPVESWGTQALAISFAGRTNGDNYRILAAYNDTAVSITGNVVTANFNSSPCQVTKVNETVVTNLMAGQFCDIIVEGPVEFQASKPIQVAHFANGGGFDKPPNDYGDPCEILLPPTGHYLMTNIVYTPFYNTDSTGDFVENFMNLIVPQSATTNTAVDGLLVASTNFMVIGGSGYYGARLSVTNGTHKVTSSRPVGVEVYGFGFWDAFGYFGGVVR